MDMEFQGKRIHRSNAITMRIRTIQTIRLTERIAIIIQINAIRTTQLTAVVEHKTTSRIKPPTEFCRRLISYQCLYFFINSLQRLSRAFDKNGKNRLQRNSSSVIFNRLAILAKTTSALQQFFPDGAPGNIFTRLQTSESIFT